MSGTQTGLRLDLRPVGEGALERPLIRCPRCAFIIAPECATRHELDTARRIVDSAEYRELARGSSGHVLRGHLLAKLRRGSPEIAFEWLSASWELEDGPAAPWRVTTERALQEFVEFSEQPLPRDLDDEISPAEARRTAQLMQVELLRRLGRFDEAGAALDKYAALPEFKLGTYATLVATERSLLQQKNAAPQPFPEVPDYAPKFDDPAYIAAKELVGWAEFERDFRLEKASFEITPGSMFTLIEARVARPLDGARWTVPLENGAARLTWNDFLRAHASIEALVKKNAWLLEWRAAGPDRHIEFWLEGLTPDFDGDIDPAWEDSGLKGEPAAKLILREGTQAVADVALAEGGGGIVTSVSEQRTLDHWLTAEPFFFFPRGDSAKYLRIGPDGKWERKVAGGAE